MINQLNKKLRDPLTRVSKYFNLKINKTKIGS